MKTIALSSIMIFISVIWGWHPCMGQSVKEADAAFARGDYHTSIEIYQQLLESDPANAEYNARLGQSYLRTYIDPLSALEYLLRAESESKRPKYLYLDIAKAYSIHLEYDQALYYLDRLEEAGGVNKRDKAEITKMRLDYLAAGDLLKYPVNLSFENAGAGVNSAYPDYHPFVTRNGKTLFYTSRRIVKPGDKPEFDGYFPSDIYVADLSSAGQQSRRINDPVNTPYDEQVVGLTDSGDSLFIYIDHVSNYGDIYLSVKSGTIYQRPKPLDQSVNTDAVESSCSISHDGKTLYFSSDRPGGSGGLDLWKITRLENGTWGLPENLGDRINTPFDEDFPNLSSDGQSLFFTSNGHPGMGGFDLFFSAIDPETKRWTTPQNAGYPINTPLDDKTISFTGSEAIAYVTAVRPEGHGDLDIYRIKYNETISDADPAIFLVNIPAIGDPAKAPEIRISDDEGNLIGQYKPHRFTNRYVFALYPGKYGLQVNAEGYKPYEETLIVNRTHLRQEQNIRIINLKSE